MVEYYSPASYSLPHVTVSADQQYGNNALQQRCSVSSTHYLVGHYLVGYSMFLLRLRSWGLASRRSIRSTSGAKCVAHKSVAFCGLMKEECEGLLD